MLNHVYFCGFLIFSSFSQISHADQFGWGWPTLYAGMNYPSYHGYPGNMAAAPYSNMMAHSNQNMATNPAYNMVINPVRRMAVNAVRNTLPHSVRTTQQHHLPRISAFVANRPFQRTRQQNHRLISGNRIHQTNQKTRHTVHAKVANIKSRIGVQNNDKSLSKHQNIHHPKQRNKGELVSKNVLQEPVSNIFGTIQNPSRAKLDHTDKNALKILNNINKSIQKTDLSNMVNENNFEEAERGKSTKEILRLLKDLNPNTSYTGSHESALRRLLLKGQNGLLSLLTGSGNGSYSNVLLSWESLHAPNSSKEKNGRRHDRARTIKQTIVFAKTANILSTVGNQHNDKSSTVMVNNGTINKAIEKTKEHRTKKHNETVSATNLTDTIKLLNKTSLKNKNSKQNKKKLFAKTKQHPQKKPIAHKTVNEILKGKENTKAASAGKLIGNNNKLTNLKNRGNRKQNFIKKINKTNGQHNKYKKIKLKKFTKHRAQSKNKGKTNFLKKKQFIFLKKNKIKGSNQMKAKPTKDKQQTNKETKQSVKITEPVVMEFLKTNNILKKSKILKKPSHVAIPKSPMTVVKQLKIKKPSLAEFAIKSADHSRRAKINEGSRTPEVNIHAMVSSRTPEVNFRVIPLSKSPGEISVSNNVERKDKRSRLTESEVIKLLDSVFSSPVLGRQHVTTRKAQSDTPPNQENNILINGVSKMPQTSTVKNVTKSTEFERNEISMKIKSLQSPEMQSVNSKFDSIDLSLRQKHPTQVSKEFLSAGPRVVKSENTEIGSTNIFTKSTFGEAPAVFSVSKTTPVPIPLQTAVRKIWLSSTKIAKGREPTFKPRMKPIKKIYTTNTPPVNVKTNMHNDFKWSDAKVKNHQKISPAAKDSIHSTFYHPNSLHTAQNLETLLPRALQNENNYWHSGAVPSTGIHSQIDQLKAWMGSDKKSASHSSADNVNSWNSGAVPSTGIHSQIDQLKAWMGSDKKSASHSSADNVNSWNSGAVPSTGIHSQIDQLKAWMGSDKKSASHSSADNVNSWNSGAVPSTGIHSQSDQLKAWMGSDKKSASHSSADNVNSWNSGAVPSTGIHSQIDQLKAWMGSDKKSASHSSADNVNSWNSGAVPSTGIHSQIDQLKAWMGSDKKSASHSSADNVNSWNSGAVPSTGKHSQIDQLKAWMGSDKKSASHSSTDNVNSWNSGAVPSTGIHSQIDQLKAWMGSDKKSASHSSADNVNSWNSGAVPSTGIHSQIDQLKAWMGSDKKSASHSSTNNVNSWNSGAVPSTGIHSQIDQLKAWMGSDKKSASHSSTNNVNSWNSGAVPSTGIHSQIDQFKAWMGSDKKSASHNSTDNVNSWHFGVVPSTEIHSQIDQLKAWKDSNKKSASHSSTDKVNSGNSGAVPSTEIHSQIDQLKAWMESNKKSASHSSTDKASALNPEHTLSDLQQVNIDFSKKLPDVAIKTSQPPMESISDFTKPWIETTTVSATPLNTRKTPNYNWSNLFPGSNTVTEITQPVYVDITPNFTSNNTDKQTIIVSAKQIDVNKGTSRDRKMQIPDTASHTRDQSSRRKFESDHTSTVNQGKTISVIKTVSNISDWPKEIAVKDNSESKLGPQGSNSQWVTVTNPDSELLNIVNEGKWIINAVSKSREKNAQNFEDNTSSFPLLEIQNVSVSNKLPSTSLVSRRKLKSERNVIPAHHSPKAYSKLQHDNVEGISVDTFMRAMPNIKSLQQDFNLTSSQSGVRDIAPLKEKKVGGKSDNIEMQAISKTVHSPGSNVRKASGGINMNNGLFNTTLEVANTRSGKELSADTANGQSRVFANKKPVSHVPSRFIASSKANELPVVSPVNGQNLPDNTHIDKPQNQTHTNKKDSLSLTETNLSANYNTNDVVSIKSDSSSHIAKSGNNKQTSILRPKNSILSSGMKASHRFSLRNSKNDKTLNTKFIKITAIDQTVQGKRKPEAVNPVNYIMEPNLSFTETRLDKVFSDTQKETNPSPSKTGKQQADVLNTNELNSPFNESTGLLHQRKILNKNFTQIRLFSRRGSKLQTKTASNKDLSSLTKYPGSNAEMSRVFSKRRQNSRSETRNISNVAQNSSKTNRNGVTNKALDVEKTSLLTNVKKIPSTADINPKLVSSLANNVQNRQNLSIGPASTPQYVTRGTDDTKGWNNSLSFGKNTSRKNLEQKTKFKLTKNGQQHNMKIHNVASNSLVEEISPVYKKKQKWVPVHPTAPEPHKGWVTLPVNNELFVRKNYPLKQAQVNSSTSTFWQQEIQNEQNLPGSEPWYHINNEFKRGFRTPEKTNTEHTSPWRQQTEPVALNKFGSNADAQFFHSETFGSSKSAKLKNNSFGSLSTGRVNKNRQGRTPGRWGNPNNFALNKRLQSGTNTNKSGRQEPSQETLSMRGNNIQVIPRQRGWRSTWPFLLNNDFELDDIMEL